MFWSIKITIDGSLRDDSYIYNIYRDTALQDEHYDRELHEEAKNFGRKLFQICRNRGRNTEIIIAEGEQRKEVEQLIQADVAEEAAMAAAAAKKYQSKKFIKTLYTKVCFKILSLKAIQKFQYL